MKPPILYRDSDNLPFYLNENGEYSSKDGFYSYTYETLIKAAAAAKRFLKAFQTND